MRFRCAAPLLAAVFLLASPAFTSKWARAAAPAGAGAPVPVEVVPDEVIPASPSPGSGAPAAGDSAPSSPSVPAVPSALPPEAAGDAAKARDLAREGRFGEAAAVLLPLLERSPGNGELLALRARILVGEQRLEDSLPVFREALLAREDPELRREMERVRVAVVLRNADRLVAEGKESEAEALLAPEYGSGGERYETGTRLGRIYLRRREFSRAASHYGAMADAFPDELDFKASRVEALLLSGDVEGGRRILEALPPADREALRVGREDLHYRIAGNSARLLGEFVRTDRGRPDEDRIGAEGSFRLGGVTAAAGASSVSRFDDRDGRLSLDLRSSLGEGTDAFGALHFSVAPDSDFLPRWSAGVEAGRSIRRHDLSAGYRHHRFPSSDAGIATASLTAWLPVGVAVSERVSAALSTGAWASLTTLRYEPDHTLRLFASISFGTLAERPEAAPDLRRNFGFADRAGFEYRPRVEFSWGADLFHEHRDSEGDRIGGSFLARYWW